MFAPVHPVIVGGDDVDEPDGYHPTHTQPFPITMRLDDAIYGWLNAHLLNKAVQL
jgi:hypothetical protein